MIYIKVKDHYNENIYRVAIDQITHYTKKGDDYCTILALTGGGRLGLTETPEQIDELIAAASEPLRDAQSVVDKVVAHIAMAMQSGQPSERSEQHYVINGVPFTVLQQGSIWVLGSDGVAFPQVGFGSLSSAYEFAKKFLENK